MRERLDRHLRPPEPAPATPAGEAMLTSGQVAERLVVSLRTLWRLVAAGKFPQPVRYSRKLVRWRASDVERAIREGV